MLCCGISSVFVFKEIHPVKEGCQKKPKIDYPCSWLYKVIGIGREEVELAIIEILGEGHYSITYSSVSSSGKYHSLNLEIEVVSEQNRDNIYNSLAAHAAIKVVL